MSKERFEQWGFESFKDNKTGEIHDNYIELLNQQDKRIAELEEQLKNATNQRKTHKNYSGFDLVNDLVKPCRVCGVKPQICDLYGYPEKYQIACMNCNCVNRDITSDDNFYVVIDLWNKLQGEKK